MFSGNTPYSYLHVYLCEILRFELVWFMSAYCHLKQLFSHMYIVYIKTTKLIGEQEESYVSYN
jgi:hypothetical protein